MLTVCTSDNVLSWVVSGGVVVCEGGVVSKTGVVCGLLSAINSFRTFLVEVVFRSDKRSAS